MQFRRSHIHFSKLNAIFISHMHGDHCFGLMGLLSTLGMLGRTSKLRVYAPKDYEPLFKQQVEYFMQTMEYEMEMIPVDTEKQQIIYEDHSLTVETVPLKHRLPCCGFIFREKPTLPHIRRDMIDYYGIPISQINNIKNGADWTTEDGVVVPNSKLTVPADAPRSYAYCSDTKYFEELADEVRGVDTIYHEATYDSKNIARAKLYNHSTAQQAATVARDAGAKRLRIGHFSARYEEEDGLLREAKEVFPDTVLAAEGVAFDV